MCEKELIRSMQLHNIAFFRRALNSNRMRRHRSIRVSHVFFWLIGFVILLRCIGNFVEGYVLSCCVVSRRSVVHITQLAFKFCGELCFCIIIFVTIFQDHLIF